MGSLHNELRRAVNIQRAIRNFLGIEEETGLERLNESLTAVLDIFERPEIQFLRQVKLWAIGGVPLAPNAAGIARFQLSNPANSGGISVVLGLGVIEQTAGVVFDILTDTGAFIAGGLAPMSARDTRWPIAAGGGSRPTFTLQTVDNTAAANSGIFLDEIATPVNDQRFFSVLPFVLHPGNYIQSQSSSLNHQKRYQAWGFEYIAQDGELP